MGSDLTDVGKAQAMALKTNKTKTKFQIIKDQVKYLQFRGVEQGT